MQQENENIQDVTQEGAPDAAGENRTARNIIKEIISWVLTIVAAVVLAFFLNRVVIINARIPSGSMENTIMEGDRLFGLRLAYTFSEPKRGDIVIFKYPDDETQNYVKRVVGLPGETVDIREAKVYINGSDTPLEEKYLKEDWIKETGPYHFEVPQDCYLMLGDNRNNSWDARYWANTYVSKEEILGKAWLRYYPLSTFGTLD